jgi:UTP--glucose-1-phosphate uridylyltransferase
VIKSAIIPVAGLGTRLLPATKSQPKEMLPVGRKPIVQYVVEELAANGIQQMLFITGRNKSSIENHFRQRSGTLALAQPQSQARSAEGTGLRVAQTKYFYTRQRMQHGLGDAVLCGEHFAGEEPFVVALGDSIIGLHAQSQAIARMIELFESRHASCVIAVEEVPAEETAFYGIVDPVDEDGDSFRIANLVEKPKPQDAPSRLAIAGRYIFSPLIFDLIRRVQPDSKGEIQLTNAIQLMCEEGKRVLGFRLPTTEKRYDIGNFPSYFETFVEFALADPAYGAQFRESLRRMLEMTEAGAAGGR